MHWIEYWSNIYLNITYNKFFFIFCYVITFIFGVFSNIGLTRFIFRSFIQKRAIPMQLQGVRLSLNGLLCR